jgi:hypothetical protein
MINKWLMFNLENWMHCSSMTSKPTEPHIQRRSKFIYLCGLFNSAISLSDLMAANDRGNKLEKMQTESIVA